MKKLIVSLSKKWVTLAAVLAGVCLALSACGSRNALSSQAPANLQEQAERDMEAGRYSAAQTKLVKVLKAHKTNYAARSLLAASYAAQGHVILLEVIANAATGVGGSSGGGGGQGKSQMTTLSGMFPSPTDENLAKIAKAVEHMNKIPVNKLTSEMTYQKGIFLSAHGVLMIKRLQESPDALSALTEEDAVLLVETLSAAASVFGQEGIGSAVGSLATAITAAPGDATKDKVASWIAASS